MSTNRLNKDVIAGSLPKPSRMNQSHEEAPTLGGENEKKFTSAQRDLRTCTKSIPVSKPIK